MRNEIGEIIVKASVAMTGKPRSTQNPSIGSISSPISKFIEVLPTSKIRMHANSAMVNDDEVIIFSNIFK